MKKIKNIAFDLGGVVIALSYEQAVKRFEEIGLKDARQHLDAFHQHGIFGDLEQGLITAEEFRIELSKLIGKEIIYKECLHAWHGYVEYVPQKNLQMLLKLRQLGYKVCLLSNTNPYMMQWAMSNEFDGQGHSLEYYFDHLYLSYQCKHMKPSPEIFQMMLDGQQASAEETLFIDDGKKNIEAAEALGMKTLFPENNKDWTEPLAKMLEIE
ncbi:HAD family hydrolase [Xylanibacter ruminicola]|uniref:Putative hydrolase of the HAD superfamily n=1 Tax=Xylanibacter ruminicola TaxID=839 RepID=A0A1M6WFC9_XYLRU|nr:HAD family phosphatase [Xylanibacter ruminicola]SHK92483.1 putative hydrolase of the HAD superfamily [Xylanibacter ruminicola]